MVRRDELSAYIDGLLNCSIYDDFTVNGLQIEGREEIHRIVTGVSPSRRMFAAAARKKADAIILHHGLFWKRGTPSPFVLRGVLKHRVAEIVKRDMNLFAYHLPLDGDGTFGNNMLIARALGLSNIRIIPETGTNYPLIAIGERSDALEFDEFCREADRLLGRKGKGIKLGKAVVSRVAIVTGAGGDCWLDAAGNGAQVLITGEISESEVRSAEEAGVHLYSGGHYDTEKWGVRALGEHLAEKFDISVEFVDIPNPI